MPPRKHFSSRLQPILRLRGVNWLRGQRLARINEVICVAEVCCSVFTSDISIVFLGKRTGRPWREEEGERGGRSFVGELTIGFCIGRHNPTIHISGGPRMDRGRILRSSYILYFMC